MTNAVDVDLRHEVLCLLHPTGYRDVRAIRKGDDPITQSYPVADLEGVDAFARTYGDRAVYVGVASRVNATGRDLKSCLELHAVFVDLDFKNSSEADARARLAAFPLKPSIVVFTGGGLHCYWLLTVPIDLRTHTALAEIILKSLCQALHADPASAEPARVLRLPGTFNHKYGEPVTVQVETVDGCRYTIEQLADILPSPDTANPKHPPIPPKIPHGGQPGQPGQHKTLFVEGCRLRRMGWQEAEIADALWTLHIHRSEGTNVKNERSDIDKIAHSICQQYEVGASSGTRTGVIEDLDTFLLRVANQPPLSWIIPGLIPDEGIVLFHGQPRDFKTWCAQEIALAMTIGRNAFANPRFACRTPVRVCYFSEEDNERVVAARMHWLMVKGGRPAPECLFPFIRKGLSFDSKEDQEFIMRRIDETSAQVSLFDPMRSFTGLSDKGPAELRSIAMFLRRIQNETTSKTLLIVHHDTKPLAVPVEGQGRSRSQMASGGGIFSISDCPVSFTKIGWNSVAVYPEDYKLSGDPTPFEVTFETDERQGVDGPQFGTWVRAVAVTKKEQDIFEGTAAKKILGFLRSTIGTWHSTEQVNSGARLKKDGAGPVLKKLYDEHLVLFCTGAEAKQRGRSMQAKLWSGVAE